MTKPEINLINSTDINIEETTPAMQRYIEIKRENPDCLLLYRMGDFYETFFEDAVMMSRELEITLTGRDGGGKLGRIPLAGIPVKSLDGYLEKLVAKDIKVAICEQLEDPKLAKGVVKRGVVRIITAGTLLESNFLNQNSNNYMCAIYKMKSTKGEEQWGFAYTDISTGEFKAAQLTYENLVTELARIQPAEVVAPAKKMKLQPFQIVPEETVDLPEEITNIYNCSKVPEKVFEENFAKENLKQVFKITDLDAIGYNNCSLGFRTAAGLLAYIWENLKEGFPKFERIETYELSEYVAIDAGTRKNLELTETMRDKGKYGTLLWSIDKTSTGMGARLLKAWICQPLKKLDRIIERQNVVKKLVDNSSERYELQRQLKNIYDIQRLSTKLSNSSAVPKDFLSLKDSLFALPSIVETAKAIGLTVFESIENDLSKLNDFAEIIDQTIREDAQNILKEGGIIKKGVNADLDYLHDLMFNGESWLKDFEQRERDRTGIST